MHNVAQSGVVTHKLKQRMAAPNGRCCADLPCSVDDDFFISPLSLALLESIWQHAMGDLLVRPFKVFQCLFQELALSKRASRVA